MADSKIINLLVALLTVGAIAGGLGAFYSDINSEYNTSTYDASIMSNFTRSVELGNITRVMNGTTEYQPDLDYQDAQSGILANMGKTMSGLFTSYNTFYSMFMVGMAALGVPGWAVAFVVSLVLLSITYAFIKFMRGNE